MGGTPDGRVLLCRGITAAEPAARHALLYVEGAPRRGKAGGGGALTLCSTATVGATLTTLVLAHLELELPDSALRIRPFPHLTTLDLRHISFPIRPSPHADVLPLFFSLLAPSLRTHHLQSGRSKGVVTINDFRALAPKLSHLPSPTSTRPGPRRQPSPGGGVSSTSPPPSA